MAFGTVKKLRTPAALRAAAKQQTNAEIQSQVSPWQIQMNQLKTRRQRALDNMSGLFNALRGYNQQSEAGMREFQGNVGELQNQAFQQAQTRLDQFRQQRAAEAQALAQQTGGPVPISAFTEGVDPGNIAPSSAAGALIGALGAGTDQVDEMGRFTNEVFPLVQAEETKSTREHFEDSINEVQSQIAALKGQRAGLRNKRYNELLAAERDYQIAGGTLGLNKRTAKENRRQFDVSTKEGRRQFDAQQRLRQQELAFRKTQATGAKVASTQAAEATQLINAITNPAQKNEDVKVSRDVAVGYMDPFLAQQKGYYTIPTDKRVDKDKHRVYYKHVQGTKTLATGGVGISPGAVNPATDQPWGDAAYGEVYLQMVGQGVKPGLAEKTVERYFHLDPGWKAPPSNVKGRGLPTGLKHFPGSRPPKPGKKKKVNKKITRKGPS